MSPSAPRNDEPLPWMESANCASVGGAPFFPEKGDSVTAAKRVCKACPVAVECLEFAQAHAKKFGVYAGLTPKQRKRLRDKNSV